MVSGIANHDWQTIAVVSVASLHREVSGTVQVTANNTNKSSGATTKMPKNIADKIHWPMTS